MRLMIIHDLSACRFIVCVCLPGPGREAEPAPSRPGVCSGALAGGRHPQGVERPGGPQKL